MFAHDALIRGVMVASTVVMIVGMKKGRKGSGLGTLTALLGAAVALACAAWSVSGSFIGSGLSNELRYVPVAGERLGRSLVERYPNARVLIITGPESDECDRLPQLLLKGLRKGLGNNMASIQEHALAMADGARNGDGDLMLAGPTAAVFDEIVKRHREHADIVVSVVGLPDDMACMEFWEMESRPELAILGAPVNQLKAAIAQGAVCAAVTFRPDSDYADSSRPPANLDAAFAKRFVLITPENVRETASKYPQLFL